MVARTAARRSRRKHTATKGEPWDVKYRLTDEANKLQLYLFGLKVKLVENQSKASNENVFKFEFRSKYGWILCPDAELEESTCGGESGGQ